jgi:hypothetical protein
MESRLDYWKYFGLPAAARKPKASFSWDASRRVTADNFVAPILVER